MGPGNWFEVFVESRWRAGGRARSPRPRICRHRFSTAAADLFYVAVIIFGKRNKSLIIPAAQHDNVLPVLYTHPPTHSFIYIYIYIYVLYFYI